MLVCAEREFMRKEKKKFLLREFTKNKTKKVFLLTEFIRNVKKKKGCLCWRKFVKAEKKVCTEGLYEKEKIKVSTEIVYKKEKKCLY